MGGVIYAVKCQAGALGSFADSLLLAMWLRVHCRSTGDSAHSHSGVQTKQRPHSTCAPTTGDSMKRKPDTPHTCIV